MRKAALICFAGGLLLAGDGIRPRGTAADYPAHETAGDLTIAGAVLTPDQVRKVFTADLNKAGFVVVEVAVYPRNGKDVDLSSSDFMLQVGSESTTARATSPGAVAAMLHRQPDHQQAKLGSNVGVGTSSTIGYESGTDPVTGRRRSGVYTEESTGVMVGPGAGGRTSPPPMSAPSDRDQRATQQIEDKALPEGKTGEVVAGYLYFPKTSGKSKNEPYKIFYSGPAAQRMQLVLAAPSGK